jgi:hypothetical protein
VCIPAGKRVADMDDEQARRFWERALREIRDDGFFAPVQTAERPSAPRVPRPRARRLHLTNVHLVLLVVALALLTTLLVIVWLAPALF